MDVASTAPAPALSALLSTMKAKVPEEQHKLLETFVLRLHADLQAPLGAAATWCDAAGLLTLFQLFREPLGSGADGVKVSVTLQESHGEEERGEACIQEGTRIVVHLADTPFMLETLRNYLKQSRLTIYLQAHTTFSVARDEQGMLAALGSNGDPHAHREMLVVILTEALGSREELQRITEDIQAVLVSVKVSVDDFPSMRDQLLAEAARLEADHPEEARFLRWVVDDNFVFMGIQTVVVGTGGLEHPEDKAQLGVYRNPNHQQLLDRIMPGMREEIDQILLYIGQSHSKEVLAIEYCQHGQSIIYASEGVDFFTIRTPGPDPQHEALILVLGRFSRTALSNRASTIPLLTRRLEQTLELSGYPAGSYLHHEFRSLYDRMPLRELFYSEPEIITGQIQEILKMQADIDVKVMARRGHHGNYVAVLTALSRNRYRAHLEDELAALLSKHLTFPVSSVTVSESGSRFIIVCYANHDPDQLLDFHRVRIEAQVRGLLMTWRDRLREALIQTLPQRQAVRRYATYAYAFEPVYKEATPPADAAEDIEIIEGFRHGVTFASRIAQDGESGQTYIKLYSPVTVGLTRIVQTFDHFGITCLHELSTTVKLKDGKPVKIQRFEVGGTRKEKKRLLSRAPLVAKALKAVHEDQLLDDELNQLVILEGFTPKEVCLLRGMRQYLLQINPQTSAATVNRVLVAHHHIARQVMESFLVRFDPALKKREEKSQERRKAFEEALADVVSLQDDQVLRRLHNIVESCLRTNYFIAELPPALSFKIASEKVLEMPAPRPWREVFVLGPHMEGIHLRGGKVARGGLRFSDRLEDFRTEVLGLMKTQMVKNAIIVPVGAKGGFVVPRLDEIEPNQRKEWVAEQYRTFIRAMLDIADNRVNGLLRHPPRVVIHDDDDPYLVVAADKGTATFSDLANQVAEEEYRFWLGDAFASGGSHGYDHKKVGITARGAWECIRLHFHEMGRDIQQEPFTVVGIGDMSGDVFGNGLLQSHRIKLVGAFNHLHIFLDPDPDPEASFQERERLFQLPRSSWTDYDKSLISAGGGVFNRTAKAIPLSEPLRALLDTREASLSGEQVIQLLLKAPVDLLYNGGIGTYIKASQESHVEVSDKANDAVRVNAAAVRALVVGEGGNLGVTQKARLELARKGVRINTDALDNSGGVDLSDHEVNLKILFADLLGKKELKGLEERNELLARLTEEVAEMVLEDNRMQHQVLTRDAALSALLPDLYLEGLTLLHDKAGLDYAAEDVPDKATLGRWLGDGGLPRPLLAIMLGYTKLFTYRYLLESEVVDLFFCERYLADYFPVSVSREFSEHLDNHFLKREIIATTLTNRVVNQTGIGPFLGAFLKVRQHRLEVNPLPTLIKAYIIAEHMLDAPGFRRRVQGLGVAVAAPAKYRVLSELEEVLLHLATWMVTHLERERITTDLINLYGKVIQSFRATLMDTMPQLVSDQQLNLLDERRQELTRDGLPMELATETVLLPYLRDVMTILHIKESLHTRFDQVGHLYIQVDDFFGLTWIDQSLNQVHHRDMWGRMTLDNVRKELWEIRTRLVKSIITFKRHNESVAEAFANYMQEVVSENDEYQELRNQLQKEEVQTLLPLSVLVRKLRDMLLHEQREEP